MKGTGVIVKFYIKLYRHQDDQKDSDEEKHRVSFDVSVTMDGM